MGRYTGPICRLCRREGVKLCDKHKCASVRRPYPPGMHGKDSHGKKSDYAKQLREKQKAKRIFGISEKHMQNYYRSALKSQEESGTELIRKMESRFDNVIFRSGIGRTRRQARQLVTHGLMILNGKRVTVPSIQIKVGDSFCIRPKNKATPLFENFSKLKLTTPKWLTIDQNTIEGKVVGKLDKADLEASIDPQMIIEFYSR